MRKQQLKFFFFSLMFFTFKDINPLPAPSSLVLLSTVSLAITQQWPENIIWKIPETNCDF